MPIIFAESGDAQRHCSSHRHHWLFEKRLNFHLNRAKSLILLPAAAALFGHSICEAPTMYSITRIHANAEVLSVLFAIIQIIIILYNLWRIIFPVSYLQKASSKAHLKKATLSDRSANNGTLWKRPEKESKRKRSHNWLNITSNSSAILSASARPFCALRRTKDVRNPTHSNLTCNCSGRKLKFKQMPCTHASSSTAIVTELLPNNAPEYFPFCWHLDPATTHGKSLINNFNCMDFDDRWWQQRRFVPMNRFNHIDIGKNARRAAYTTQHFALRQMVKHDLLDEGLQIKFMENVSDFFSHQKHNRLLSEALDIAPHSNGQMRIVFMDLHLPLRFAEWPLLNEAVERSLMPSVSCHCHIQIRSSRLNAWNWQILSDSLLFIWREQIPIIFNLNFGTELRWCSVGGREKRGDCWTIWIIEAQHLRDLMFRCCHIRLFNCALSADSIWLICQRESENADWKRPNVIQRYLFHPFTVWNNE